MSLFGSIMGDLDDDPYFGAHMRSMRQMNNMMNSLFADPFGMMGGFGMGGPPALTMGARHSMVPFGFPPMPQLNMNRLLSAGSLDPGLGDHGFSSSSVVSMSMTAGPDGRPQVIQSSASTRTGPGGIRETKRTHVDSRSGTKKMAIGHHIGSRSHVVEREQNTISGDQEERQEFINLEEEEAEDFNREFERKARETFHHGAGGRRHSGVPQIMAGNNSGPSAGGWRSRMSSSAAGGRRSLRTPSPSPLALTAPVSVSVSGPGTHHHHSPRANSSISRHPYSTVSSRRAMRQMKSVSGNNSSNNNYHEREREQYQQNHDQDDDEPCTVTITDVTEEEDDDQRQQHE